MKKGLVYIFCCLIATALVAQDHENSDNFSIELGSYNHYSFSGIKLGGHVNFTSPKNFNYRAAALFNYSIMPLYNRASFNYLLGVGKQIASYHFKASVRFISTLEVESVLGLVPNSFHTYEVNAVSKHKLLFNRHWSLGGGFGSGMLINHSLSNNFTELDFQPVFILQFGYVF